MASRALKPTLVIVMAAGLAAGIGLARPDLGPSDSTDRPAAAEGSVAPDGGPAADPYGRAADPAPEPDASNGADGAGSDGAGDAGSDGAGGAAETATITISDFDFGEPLVVAPGATVRVENSDRAPHTVTAEGDEFDTSQIGAGSSTTFVAPTEPGTYEFFCGVHPSMTGTLVVEA